MVPEDDVELKDIPQFIYAEAMEELMRPTIYAIFEKDQIIYIGATGDLRQRLRHHTQHLFQIEEMTIGWIHVSDKASDMTLAHYIEKNLIRKYQPRYNIKDGITHTLAERRRKQQEMGEDLGMWLKKYGKSSLKEY